MPWRLSGSWEKSGPKACQTVGNDERGDDLPISDPAVLVRIGLGPVAYCFFVRFLTAQVRPSSMATRLPGTTLLYILSVALDNCDGNTTVNPGYVTALAVGVDNPHRMQLAPIPFSRFPNLVEPFDFGQARSDHPNRRRVFSVVVKNGPKFAHRPIPQGQGAATIRRASSGARRQMKSSARTDGAPQPAVQYIRSHGDLRRSWPRLGTGGAVDAMLPSMATRTVDSQEPGPSPSATTLRRADQAGRRCARRALTAC